MRASRRLNTRIPKTLWKIKNLLWELLLFRAQLESYIRLENGSGMKPSFELSGKGSIETELHHLWEPNVNWYKPTLLFLNALMRKEHWNYECSFLLLTPFLPPVGEKCLFFLYNFSLLYVAKCLVIVLYLTDLLLRSCQQPKDN